MSLEERGFFSIDAFFALVLLITISGMLLSAAQGSEQIARETTQLQEADMIVEKLAGAINTVYTNGSSFELQVDLPDNIVGENYTVSFNRENREVYIKDLEGVSSDVARASIIPNNLYDFELNRENLENTIRVYWPDDNIGVISHE